MSIYFSGSRTRSAGIISAILKEKKHINLKPVKRIQVQFDPFTKESLVARHFLTHINTSEVHETNYNCPIKTEIVNDRSQPCIRVDLLEGGRSIRFLAGNLNVLDILRLFNKHISSLVEPESETPIIETKQEKKRKRKQK